MADPLKTYVTCSRCRGTKVDGVDDDGNPKPCSACAATGVREVGQTDGADTLEYIKKKIQKICVKLDIPED